MEINLFSSILINLLIYFYHFLFFNVGDPFVMRLHSCWYNIHAAMVHPQSSLRSIEWPYCPLNCCGLTQKRLLLWHHSGLSPQRMRKRLSCWLASMLGSAGVASLTAQPLIFSSPKVCAGREGPTAIKLVRAKDGTLWANDRVDVRFIQLPFLPYSNFLSNRSLPGGVLRCFTVLPDTSLPFHLSNSSLRTFWWGSAQ